MTTSMRRLGWLALPLVLAASLGCGDDGSTGTGGGGGTGGTSGTGGDVGSGGGATVTIFGAISSYPGFVPVEDGNVCFIAAGAQDLCTPTGVEGAYSLAGVPSNTAGSLRFRGSAIVTFYTMLVTQSDDLEIGVAVETPAFVQQYYSQAGVSAGADDVVVVAQFYPNGPGGVLVLTPTSGQGPYYLLDATGAFDLTATATTELGLGVGLFLDVKRSDGPFSLQFELDGQTCDTPYWGADLPPWEIPADADEVFVQFQCGNG